jgi:hypothetical protein
MARAKRTHAQKTDAPNAGGWKMCSRGHKYRGPGPCPICWAGGVKRSVSKTAQKRPR